MAFAPPPSMPPHSHPNLSRYAPSALDEPYSDAASAYDSTVRDHMMPESPSIDRDNKLLSFSTPTYNYTLLDFSGMRTSVSITAQLHGMFFLAESPWATTGEPSKPATELTCYRRNLFQISGQITMSRTMQCIMTEQGERIPIIGQDLAISATESVEGNPVKVISVPWKTPTLNGQIPEDKTEKEPPPLPIDLNSTDVEAEYATFPIAWKRLQFRIATANNGRRKELQQHFVVHIKLMATLATGNKVSVAEAHSGAIIVRGRSPRNFQSRKDFPLNGGGSTSRKHQHGPSGGSLSRTSTGESGQQQQHPAPSSATPATTGTLTSDTGIGPVTGPGPTSTPAAAVAVTGAPAADMSMTSQQIAFQYDPHDLQMSPGFVDWVKLSTQNQPGSLTAIPNQNYQNPTHKPSNARQSPVYAQSSPEASRYSTSMASAMRVPAPINLSLTDDHPPQQSLSQKRQSMGITNSGGCAFTSSAMPNSSSSANASAAQQSAQSLRSNKTPRLSSIPRPPSFSSKFLGSPDESADSLYEYFPLGLDDWMPPVDAVYRPHVVHHTNMPKDPKAMAVRSRSKRYFSEDHQA
ncbi:p53-like transcription factor [Xylona heveae TC161]|uniref:p53-like transcription factor n=1 Tax=Xylona heveae (strain CBS 132557 / TC161) TaxID=1328760 RepID=A0A165H0P7_XYLHT|nr:p53-like transcription factor [Xylona heveae TC161]KZF22840.1 p53-like transcription factor [Xylona heveae TC161]